MWSQRHSPYTQTLVESHSWEHTDRGVRTLYLTWQNRKKIKPEKGCGQREEWSELGVLSREQGRLTKDEGEGEGGPLTHVSFFLCSCSSVTHFPRIHSCSPACSDYPWLSFLASEDSLFTP